VGERYCNELRMWLFLFNFQMNGMDGGGAVLGNCGVGEGIGNWDSVDVCVCVCGGGFSPNHNDPSNTCLFAIKASLGPACTFSCFVTLDSFAVGKLIRAEKKDEWVGVDKVLGTNNFTFVGAAQRLYSFFNCNGHLVWCTAGDASDAMRYLVQVVLLILVPSSGSLFVTSSCDSHRGGTRVCSECHEHFRSSSFSNKQWKGKQRATLRRCRNCVDIAMVCLSSSSV
jgi:hypothetical protein